MARSKEHAIQMWKDGDWNFDDYGSKVDALVDSMSVTDEKESTVHRRKDLDSL